MKRRGKSPPPVEQSAGHDKPHAVQGRTGSMSRLTRLRASGGSFRVLAAFRASGTRRASGVREMIVQRQNSAYRHPLHEGAHRESMGAFALRSSGNGQGRFLLGTALVWVAVSRILFPRRRSGAEDGHLSYRGACASRELRELRLLPGGYHGCP